MNHPNGMMIDEVSVVPFIEGQRLHIEREVNRNPLMEIQYPQLIPVDTSAHPWTETVEFSSIAEYGRADWINGNADDIPRAGTTAQKYRSSVYMAGIGYGYGYAEIEIAQLYGRSLPNDDAFAARRAAEEMVERVALEETRRRIFTVSSITPPSPRKLPSTATGTRPATKRSWRTSTRRLSPRCSPRTTSLPLIPC